MATIDLSNVPGAVSIANTGAKDVKLTISGYNQGFILGAGDTVVLHAENSSDLVGYLSQQTDTLVVTLPEKEEEEAVTPTEPSD